MDFATLIAPVGVETFLADYYGKRPLHIPADPVRRVPLDWSRLSDLLSIAPQWSEGNLRLVLNSRPILADFYMDEVRTHDGVVRRADPAKVEVFLAMGASLVANDAEQVAPELRSVTDMLGERFAALTNANVYCSFKGVQAFDSHYDLHEVFALQCEGEKRWRIYRGRAENPVSATAATQDEIDAARGPLLMEVRMCPGDVLYLPRGVYHDALAEEGASLHVSFSAAPHSGRIVLQLLEAAAMRDPAFGAYLPDWRVAGGQALTAHLRTLGERLAAIAASPGFAYEIVDAARARARPAHRVSLPERGALISYARTERAGEVRRTADGAVLVANGRQAPLGTTFAIAEYALSRPAFSVQELGARFAHVPAVERAALITLFEREGLIAQYTPEL